MAIYDINGNSLIADSESVETHFIPEVEDTVAKVKALQTEPCLTFFVCADVHYASHDKTVFPKTVNNMRAVAKGIRSDGILCLGDMTDGKQTKADTRTLLSEILPLMMNSGLPVYFTAGNHDDNAYLASANYFTNSEMYVNYYSYYDSGVVSEPTYGINFYKDFDQHKIRLISLDASNSDVGTTPHYKYSGNTTTWFNTVLNATPSGYLVLLITHLSPISSHNWNNTVPTNASTVLNTINTWMNGGGEMISLMGHSHSDFYFDTPYLEVAISCNRYGVAEDYVEDGTMDTKCPVGAKFWGRQEGTITEDCWDAVVIRPTSRKVNLVRFGAGEDREFTY